jgi:hypothetical protein
MGHPYRRPSPRPKPGNRRALDAEEWGTHAFLALVGLAGVLVGLLWSRPTELALGSLLAVYPLRVLWREVISSRGRKA